MNSDALKRTTQLLSYSTLHPCRSPSWRWGYVQRLVALDRHPLTDLEDGWIQTAYDFLGYEATQQAGQPTHTLLDVSEAHEIYQCNAPARWELEARILAGERYVAIAEKLDIRIGVVKAYQNVFFHVKPKLKFRDYIHNVVIGTFRLWDPARVRDLWCYFGFSAGPEMVDFLVSDFRNSQKPDYGHLTDGSEPDPNRSTLGRKFDRCLKMMFIPVNQKTILPLIELRIELMAAEKLYINPFAENAFAGNVDRMLAETLKVGKSAKTESARRNKSRGVA
jgi:hypothetical protein